MSTLLADLTWEEAERQSDGSVLAIPLGATEQHGPHLPLSTDSDIALALAKAVSRERPLIVAPTVAFGSSGEHAGFPGTLSIGAEAMVSLLVELVRSASPTFPRIILISAHGGNRRCVRQAEAQLREDGHDVRAFFPSWSGDAHAGRVETSLMLALAPDWVHLERAAAGNTSPLPEILPRLVAHGVRAVSANGVLGDPHGATADEGHALLRRAAAELTAFLDSWHE